MPAFDAPPKGDPYDLGAQAYADGEGLEENPYDVRFYPEQFSLWVDGWSDEKQSSKGE